MPSRKVKKRIKTEEVQGKDSYVVMTSLKVYEMRSLRKKQADSRKQRNDYQKTLQAYSAALESGKTTADLVIPEEPDYIDPVEEGLELLKQHVIEWNWVDDEGEPLPQPKDDPEVIYQMTDDETKFLTEILSGEREAKN